MFKKLRTLIFATIAFTVLWYFVDLMVTMTRFKFRHWKTFWVWNGVQELIYLISSSAVVFIWRPNDNNQKYAYSQQINQSEEEMHPNSSAPSFLEESVEDPTN